MNRNFVGIFCLVMSLFGTITTVYAQPKDTSLDAHVHGLSDLTIAIEAEAIEIQFTSPAMNLVGFEHKASSKKDIASVNNAESILDQPESLFIFSGSDCRLVESKVVLSGLIEEDHQDHEDHEDHKDHKDHKHHEGHEDHKDHKDHEDHQGHSEIVGHYSYRCSDLSKLSSIKTVLFESFPGIYKINAMWVMPSKQGSTTLTANNPTVILR